MADTDTPAKESLLPLPARLRAIAFHHTRPGLVPDVMREAADAIDALLTVLDDATAWRSREALNSARVLLGGPDMDKHDKRCRLFGSGRVECVPACPLSSPEGASSGGGTDG